jgi:hypothetical protein
VPIDYPDDARKQAITSLKRYFDETLAAEFAYFQKGARRK